MLSKNEQIAKTLRETRERHARLDIKVYKVKISNNKLSRAKKEILNGVFREAKWLRNDVLASDNVFKYKIVDNTVSVLVGDTKEDRTLDYLGSQIKQSVVSSVVNDIKGLSSSKNKGRRIGKLKFKSYCNSVPLKQFGNTYKIDFDKNRIRIQKWNKYPFKVRGLKQIPGDAEIANAQLVRKPDGYYFHITCYVPKTIKTKKDISEWNTVGLDFGIEYTITLSTGEVFVVSMEEDKKIKLASRRVNKALHKNGTFNTGKKSNNHKKRVGKLQIAYQKLDNKKKDRACKFVSSLVNSNDFIAIQDEMLAGWHSGWFGKQVQHSCMGEIKVRLMKSDNCYVVESSFPSTQLCPKCCKQTKHALDKREYKCSYCGYEHPSRDQKSAQTILNYVLNLFLWSAERRVLDKSLSSVVGKWKLKDNKTLSQLGYA